MSKVTITIEDGPNGVLIYKAETDPLPVIGADMTVAEQVGLLLVRILKAASNKADIDAKEEVLQ